MNSPLIPSLRIELQQLRPSGYFGVEPLPIPVEWMRYCERCDGEQRFVADLRCDSGLVAHCARCGLEAVAPYTRANGEAGMWEEYT